MSFTLPTFNLDVNVWHQPAVPPAPRSAVLRGNLAFGRRVEVNFVSSGNWVQHLLLPPGADIRGPYNASNQDAVEVPAGSGRFYHVYGVDDIGKGFPNEHRVALLIPTASFGFWPTPIP